MNLYVANYLLQGTYRIVLCSQNVKKYIKRFSLMMFVVFRATIYRERQNACLHLETKERKRRVKGKSKRSGSG